MDDHLVHMANDIAKFHESFPEDEAMQMVAEHINKSWAPSMRQKLFEEFQAHPCSFNNLIAKSLLRINCDKYNPIRAAFREKEGTGG
jgi:formate dehydrogenase subunit delta